MFGFQNLFLIFVNNLYHNNINKKGLFTIIYPLCCNLTRQIVNQVLMKNLLLALLASAGVTAGVVWAVSSNSTTSSFLERFTTTQEDEEDLSLMMATSQYCETQVDHFPDGIQTGSEILLTITSVDEQSMTVEIKSADNDPVNFLLVNSVTGSPMQQQSNANGVYTETLTWTEAAPPVDVALNILWRKASSDEIQWQLAETPITIPFDATCDGDGGGGTECVAEVFENFDEEGLLTLTSQTGTYEDGVADPSVGASNLVGKYTRNANEQFDNIQFSTSVVTDASEFVSGDKLFTIDIYTDAPVGTTILLQLENPATAEATNFPTGRHSVFAVTTTVTGEWETLQFAFDNRPDGAVADNTIGRVVFLFNPNSFTTNVFHFDNFGVACPSDNGNGGGTMTCEPTTIENFDEEGLLTLTSQTGTYEDGVADPSVGASNLVGKYTRNANEQFDNIQFSTSVVTDASEFVSGDKLFTIDIYTDAPVGTTILLQLENPATAEATNFPTGRHSVFAVTTTVTGEWETLQFAFDNRPDGAVADNTIGRVVFLFNPNSFTTNVFHFDNFGVACPGDTGGGGTASPNTIVLPIDFECEFIDYLPEELGQAGGFNGAGAEIADNPDAGDGSINQSAKVLKVTRDGGDVFAGTFINLPTAIDFTKGKTFTLKVYSTKDLADIGQINFALKLEEPGGGAEEIPGVITVTNTWQELTYEFTTDATTFSRVTLLPDLGNVGAGEMFFIDDIRQVGNDTETNCQGDGGGGSNMPTVAAITPPVCETATAIYSDAYAQIDGINFDAFSGSTSIAEIQVEGNNVYQYSTFDFQGIQFPNLDVSELTTLHVDVWSPDATTLNIFLISPPVGDGTAQETPSTLALTAGEWNSFDIPLTEFAEIVDLTNVFQFKFADGDASTYYIDNLYFYGDCNPIPDCPQLVWADEFDGSSLNVEENWEIQIGDGRELVEPGWGNQELQNYQAENVVVSDGTLKITAEEEATDYFGTQYDYTAGRIRTANLQDFTYGRFEASIKLPIGQGIWPAFWLLHTDPIYGTWPESGEIDIMEYLGQEPDFIFGTVHYGTDVPFNPQNTSRGFRKIDGGFDEGFFEYAVEWEENEIRWYVDDYLYGTIVRDEIESQGFLWPYNQPFHIILNLAVGGALPGSPDETTTFPQTMEVEYVRVYKGRFPHLTGNDRVTNQAAGEIYTVENAGEGATYNWMVEGGTIVEDQGNQIVVDWGDQATSEGQVSVTIGYPCTEEEITIDLEVQVDVKRVATLECVIENFDEEGLLTLIEGNSEQGTLTEVQDPFVEEETNLVAQYVRSGATFDNIQYTTAAIPDAGRFSSGASAFFMDVYTDAAPGTEVLIQLENAEKAVGQFPIGRHSTYQAFTTTSGEWETLEFFLLARRDAGTTDTEVDKLVVLIKPNSDDQSTYYFDNLERFCTDTEINCAAASVNCSNEPTIASFSVTDSRSAVSMDNNGEAMGFDVIDPCSCTDPLNTTVNGVFLFHDILTVPGTPGQTIEVVTTDGEFRDANDNPIAVPVNVPEVAPGIYQLDFYHRSGLATDIVVRMNGNVATDTPFTSSLCDVATCAPPTAVPTLSQWGLFLFGLFMAILGTVFMYNRMYSGAMVNE